MLNLLIDPSAVLEVVLYFKIEQSLALYDNLSGTSFKEI